MGERHWPVAKLADFGLAKMKTEASEMRTFVGTMRYLGMCFFVYVCMCVKCCVCLGGVGGCVWVCVGAFDFGLAKMKTQASEMRTFVGTMRCLGMCFFVCMCVCEVLCVSVCVSGCVCGWVWVRLISGWRQ